MKTPSLLRQFVDSIDKQRNKTGTFLRDDIALAARDRIAALLDAASKGGRKSRKGKNIVLVPELEKSNGISAQSLASDEGRRDE